MLRHVHRIWILLIRRSQFLVSLSTGALVALTVLGAGLGMIKFHGGRWQWWFHGVAIALITGLITTALTQLHVRELRRREARRLAGERMSHEVCTALQILFQCTYLQPDQRSQLEGEAIERIRVAVREVLPNILEIPTDARPIPSVASCQRAEVKHKSGNASSATAG